MQLWPQVTDGARHIRLAGRFLDGADWSEVMSPFAAQRTYREMVDLLERGSAVSETRSYQYLLEAAAAGRPVNRNGVLLNSPALIDKYFQHYLALVESIRSDGMRRWAEQSRQPGSPASAVRPREVEAQERDASVAIAADGQLVRFLGGRHRTAIAQALNLPTMPVEVRLVHVGWLNAVARETGLPAHEALLAGLSRPFRPGPRLARNPQTGRASAQSFTKPNSVFAVIALNASSGIAAS
jgi:hypothetical protein